MAWQLQTHPQWLWKTCTHGRLVGRGFVVTTRGEVPHMHAALATIPESSTRSIQAQMTLDLDT